MGGLNMHTNHPTRRVLLTIGACLVLDATAQTAPPITRELRVSRSFDFTNQTAALVLQELYRRAGIRLIVIEMPVSRAAIEAKEGRIDGEVIRVRTYSDNAPQLLRVEPPIYFVSLSAFYRKGSAVRVQILADLNRYSVAYVRGSRFAEDMTKGMSRAITADSEEQLLHMLQAGHIDVFLMGTVAARLEMRKLGMADTFDHTELAKLPLYHLLHEKNRDLLPVISAQLRKATDSGELEKLTDRFEKQFFDTLVPPKK
jgi:polar amino acid transport system substrate-binding protein